MAQRSNFESDKSEQDACPLFRLPAELRNDIYELLFAMPTETVELIDARKRNDGILRTCQMFYEEAKKLFDANGAGHAAYWARDFNVTKPSRRDELTQLVPNWCFAHITALHIHSRALTCDLERHGNIWLGHASWTVWNKPRQYHPYGNSHVLLTETIEDDPEYWLTDINETKYEDLKNYNIVPVLSNGNVSAVMTAKKLVDFLGWEYGSDFDLPVALAGGPGTSVQRVQTMVVKKIVAPTPMETAEIPGQPVKKKVVRKEVKPAA